MHGSETKARHTSPEPGSADQAGDHWRVALTFDAEHHDRPSREGGTERTFATLAVLGVRATAFVQGRWAEAKPELIREISSQGHLIGTHSHHHARMSWLSPEGFNLDVRMAQDTIAEITGSDPSPWFRCPFGDGTDDPVVLSRLQRLGYQEIGWNVDPFDWDPQSTHQSVAETVIEETHAHGDGAIVLMHPWTDSTAESLPLIVAALRSSGATFVGVDELG